MGVLIDLREELKLRVLARRLVDDLCVDDEVVESLGGVVAFAKEIMRQVDALPEGNSETICDEHPELFGILRRKAAG